MNSKRFGRWLACGYLCLLVGSGLVPAAGAQDLQQSYESALKNDPQLKGTEYEALASRETLRQAYAGMLPRLWADLSYTITYQDVNRADNPVYATGSTDYDTQNYGVTLVQPLFRYASFIAISQARTVAGRADLELEKGRQDLALRLSEAYMEALLAADKLEAVKAEESAVALQHERARERADKGMAPITDRYDTEARLATVSAQRVETENQLSDSLQLLAEICGTPATELRRLKDEIPLAPPVPGNVDQWLETGLKQNLELRIQQLKAAGADKETERLQAAHYPTLDFQFDFANKDTKGSLFGGGSNTNNFDLMFKLTIPLFEGGLTTAKAREAAYLQQSAQQGVVRLSRQAERKIRSLYNGVLSAMNRVQAMKKSVDAQQLVVEAKQEGFRSGLYISLAVLDAMQDLYRYKKEYALARNDYILNSLRLKHAVGALKPEELSLVNGWLRN